MLCAVCHVVYIGAKARQQSRVSFLCVFVCVVVVVVHVYVCLCALCALVPNSNEIKRISFALQK